MERLKVGLTFEMTVDRLARGGYGVGRHPSGVVVFVPFSSPSDLLLVTVTKSKKSHAFAKIEKILTPSTERRTPPCDVFGKCGGCSFQHIPYEIQVREKTQILRHSLRKLLSPEVLGKTDVKHSPKEWHYRNRIQVNFNGERWFYKARESHQPVAFSHCHIAEKKINEVLQELKGIKPGRYEVGLDKEGSSYVLAQKDKRTKPVFSQVNTGQNRHLIEHALGVAKTLKPEKILELFSGRGNFTFELSELPFVQEISAADNDALAIQEAKEVSNSKTHFQCLSAEDTLKQCEETYDLLLLDPPRAGAGEAVMAHIARLQIPEILYISCDPMTLSRDLERLTQSKYAIRSVQGFDMFPQTDHMEVFVHLSLGTRVN